MKSLESTQETKKSTLNNILLHTVKYVGLTYITISCGKSALDNGNNFLEHLSSATTIEYSLLLGANYFLYKSLMNHKNNKNTSENYEK